MAEQNMRRWGSWTASNDCRNKSGILKGEGELEVEIGVGNGGQTQACLRGVVKVRAYMSKIDERHFESLYEGIGP
jgi:hypothetical protein